MSSQCVLDRIEKNGKCIIRLQGNINEDFDGSILVNENSKSIFIDFNEIEKINSCGVREFVDTISQIEDKQLYYVNCPKVLIDQVNMVKGFIGSNAVVLSFYAPYYCDETDEEHSLLIKVSELKDITKAPAMTDSKGRKLTFDDFEEKYFKFLKSQESQNG